ncbi:MAG: aspartate--tRNA ligase [Acholeplasmataceae bacterium]|nr:MAG: aspartate--tRNA ligase [Acholeplasmataceae bacterium]
MSHTHHNNALTLSELGQQVRLKGWVQKVRNLGGLVFIDLRDRHGITQLVVKPENPHYEAALKIKNEYVITIEGTVIERESKNKNLPTGDIEVDVSGLTVLSTAANPPLIIADQTDALEEVRLRYRYLDLRRPVMQRYMIMRHDITQAIRTALLNEGYYEFETPMLGKSTPEGARDYLVPSRLYPGQFYALPQSPQIYKQLFMVAGFEKYFQVARCFRDEDLRADRQPEFTQIDIEASFVDETDVQALVERVLSHTFKTVLKHELTMPFARMTYADAMRDYGTDKPDTRYDMLLKDYSALFAGCDIPLFKDKQAIKGLVLEAGATLTRKQIDQLTELVKKHHGEALAWLKYEGGALSGSLARFIDQTMQDKLGLKDGDILFVVPGSEADVAQSLGVLRETLARMFDLIPKDVYHVVWITDWPLLEYNEEDGRYYAKHHPFTAPADPDMLKHDPAQALAKAYDIVLNGHEIGGGSIRIHDQAIQKLMFKTLGLDDHEVKRRFGFFVDALKYGTPPHGGIALGLDRIVMLMTHTENIKDVVAFPKTQSAKDLMMQSPDSVDEDQLEALKIKVGE